MTWEELAKKINQLSPEAKQTDVTIYLSTSLEYVPACDFNVKPKLNDVLDAGHPFLVICF